MGSMLGVHVLLAVVSAQQLVAAGSAHQAAQLVAAWSAHGADISTTEECPGGWLDFGEYGCFKFLLESSGLSWFEASAECERAGGFLAEPKTKAISDMLYHLGAVYQGMAGVDHWYIGLTDFESEGLWRWYHSGEPLTENSWGPGRPDPDQSLENDCAAMVLQVDENTYFWDDIKCFPEPESLGAPICQTGSTSSPGTTTTPSTGGSTTTSSGGGGSTTTASATTTGGGGSTPPAGDCQTGWLDFNGNTYCVVMASATWEYSEAHCASLGAHLASVHSAEENSYLGSVTDGNSFWIGGTANGEEENWHWSDGSPWDFIGWAEGEPNGTGDCAAVQSGLLGWKDYKCAISLVSVCKIIGGGTMAV